jgi:hypothetical protein
MERKCDSRLNGEACRWIEIEEMYDGQDKPQIHKLLVAEMDLIQSAQPVSKVKRWISKFEDQITVQGDDFLDRAGAFGPSFVFLTGAMKGSKPIAESKQVEYQSGKLSIDQGRKGSYVWGRKYKTIEGSVTFKWDYTIWMHPNVPFGFAHSNMKLTVRSTADDAVRVIDYEFLLRDTGTDAKSAIQDATD